MTDEALLQRFAANADHDAFAQLTMRHMDWVYASARRTLGDAHLAEDATQAVFLLLSRKAAGMSPRVRVTGWLFNAVRFICRDIVKTRRRREMHEARTVTTAAEPDDFLAVLPLVDDAVARLGEADRLALLLRFHRGMEYAQIAEEMRATPDGARKRVDRALARMRAYLASRAGELPDRFEESLARQMACAAPAGLASTIAATISGSASPAVSALVARAVTLLRWAKIKVVWALSAATLASAGVAAAVVAAQTGGSHAPAVVAAPATAPATLDLGALLTSQKLQADRRTAVIATITGIIGPDVAQRLQDATTAAAGAIGTGQVRLGSAEQIHGILREEYMADSIKGLSNVNMGFFYGGLGSSPLSNQAQDAYSTRTGQGRWFIFTNGNLRGYPGGGKLGLAVDFRPEIRIDPAGTSNQPYKPAGAMNVGFTCDAGQTAVVITPIVTTADLELYALAVVETIPCDQADETALRYYHLSPMKDWLNEPIARKLLRSRQIALWRAAFDQRVDDSRWSWQLPGGATVKLRALGRSDLHPLLRFGPDGAPAWAIIGGMSRWKAGVEIELTDPHGKDSYPQHQDTHDSELPDAAMVGATGSLQVGVGDGEYKKVGELRLEKDATTTVDGVTYRMIAPPHDGVDARLDHTMRRDQSVTFAMVNASGQRRFEEYPAAVLTGEQPDRRPVKDYYVRTYIGADFRPTALEIWARPRLWHTFEGFAVRPSKPVPTEAEAYASMIKGELPRLDTTPSSASVPATMPAWTPRNVWTRTESPTFQTNEFHTADGRYYTETRGQTESRYVVFDGQECRTWDDSRQVLRVSKWLSGGGVRFEQTVRQLASVEREMKLVDPKPVDLGNGEGGREFTFTLEHGRQTGRARLDAKGRPRLFATSDGTHAQYIEYDLADDSRWFAVNRDSFAKVIDDDRADALCASLTPPVPANAWAQHLGRNIAIHDVHRSENGMILLCVTTMLDPKTVQAITNRQGLVGWTRGQLLNSEYPAFKAVPLLAIDAPERSTRWYALVPADAKEPLDVRALRLDLSFRSSATNREDGDRAIIKAANADGPALAFLQLPPVPNEIVPLEAWLKDAASAMLKYRGQTADLGGYTWPCGNKTPDEIVAHCRKAIADSPHTMIYWP